MPYLYAIQKMLKEKTFHTSTYEVFRRIEGPKEREISKLPFFPDRIVQWAILLQIEPYLNASFIDDTYSAVKGKGIHYGKRKVEHAIKKDGSGCTYCYKIDIYHYYQSIHHDILKQQYRRLFKDKDLLWLIDEIIDSTPGNIGIPIGNYLSQFSGNLYLSGFDHYVKEKLSVKHYYRYMDDIVIMATTKEELRALLPKIQAYLKEQLCLQIKPNWQIFPTYVRGLDFLGYREFRKYSLLRKRVKKNAARTLLKHLAAARRNNGINLHQYGSISSYKGWIEHCNSYKLINKYVRPLFPYMADFWNKRNIERKHPKKQREVKIYEKLWHIIQY